MQSLLRKPPARSGSLVELMLDCHERIRKFSRLASAIAAQRDAPEADIVQACADVRRYFQEALPLHVADEEESILPRLRRHSAELDDTLALMHAQHLSHEPKLTAMLSLLAAIQGAPHETWRRDSLAIVAAELEQEFKTHLELEERVIFPAVAALDAGAQAEVRAELRARRRTAG
jgi:iron-sulfur cluster repair protein YtfE (RIC family)